MHSKVEKIKGFKIFSDLKYRLILEGIGVGLVVGVVISSFRLVLSKVDSFRTLIIDQAKDRFFMIIIGLIILFSLLLIPYIIKKEEPLAGGSGIPQVKGEIEGNIKSNWLRVLVLKYIGSISAITAGLSLGSEGPSIQLGGMIGKGFSRFIKRDITEERYLIVCGAGAGLAAAFGAPLAGIVFVLEEFRRKFSHKALLSTMSASITSDWIASSIFGLDPVFKIDIVKELGLEHFWTIILLGIVIGILGSLFIKGILLSQGLFKKLEKKSLSYPILFILLVIFAIFYPNVLGSGYGLISYVGASNLTIGALILLLVLKYVFSIVSIGSGIPGGSLIPLLVLGGITGSLFLTIFGPLLGLSMDVMGTYIVLGMLGYFASIVRAPITGIILIAEMTQALDCLLPFAIVSLVSYLVSEFIGTKPLFEELLDRMLKSGAKFVKKDEDTLDGTQMELKI